MFQKRQGWLKATDDSTGATVHFLYSLPGSSSHGAEELTAYESGSVRYLINSESVWHRKGILRRKKLCTVRVWINSIRHEQITGPTVLPVKTEVRESVANQLKAAANALGICCELIA
jgi:hypothetical protein